MSFSMPSFFFSSNCVPARTRVLTSYSTFEMQRIFDNIMNRDIPWPHVPEEMNFDAYDLIDK